MSEIDKKWTPGPWKFWRDSKTGGPLPARIDSEGPGTLHYRIVSASETYDFDGPNEQQVAITAKNYTAVAQEIREGRELANAHLISAAPELYEALEECLREHGGYTIKGGVEKRAKKALAKARGENEK